MLLLLLISTKIVVICVYLSQQSFFTFLPLFCIVLIAATISCYKCHATDAEKCKETQKQTPCDSAKGEDICITVLYKDKFHRNGRYVQQTYMAKSCAPRNYSCPWMCTSLESTGHTGCKVCLLVLLLVSSLYIDTLDDFNLAHQTTQHNSKYRLML